MLQIHSRVTSLSYFQSIQFDAKRDTTRASHQGGKQHLTIRTDKMKSFHTGFKEWKNVEKEFDN